MTRIPKQVRCTNCRHLLKPGAPNSTGSGDIWAHEECPPMSFQTRLVAGKLPVLVRRSIDSRDEYTAHATSG